VFRATLIVLVVDEDGATTRSTARFDVAPSIADHDASAQIEGEGLSRLHQQTGERLATIASIAVIVGTNEDRFEAQPLGEGVIERLDGRS
jgi:hypothetical protein